MDQEAPEPAELPPQEPDAVSSESAPASQEQINHRAGQLAAIDYNLFRSHPLRMEVCRREVEHMLRSGQGVTARFEPVTNFLGMVKREEDGTPKMALALYDQATGLKLTLNPHDNSRPLRLSQTKEIPADDELPAGTPEVYAEINALSRSGQSMADILASNPEAASILDTAIRTTVETAKADENNGQSALIDGGAALTRGIASHFSKSASIAFGAIDAAQSLRDNRPAQAAIDMVKSLPGVGLVLSEILQLIGNKMGLDVEPSLLQKVGDGIEVLNSVGPTGEFNGLAACGDKARPAPTMIANNDKIDTTGLELAHNSLIPPVPENREPATPPPASRPNLQPF